MKKPHPHAQLGVAPFLTDFYQLAMLQAYWRQGMHDIAVFEFFVRRLPRRRNYLIAAGLEQALEYLRSLRFAPADIEWLRASGKFDGEFLDWLSDFRFSGDVHAMPEGTAFFQDEPILRITATLAQAQFVESRIVNLLQYQTLVASKAARMVMSAPGAMLIDFGMRRAHGAEAALLAARAAYAVGFAGSATLEAERAFGVPSFGTMAHSFILAHANEAEAFMSFAQSFPSNVVLLIDTYDTIEAAENLQKIAEKMSLLGIAIQGVRLDSGDLIDLAGKVRAILDSSGLKGVKILASSSVNEDLLASATKAKAPIDGYGVGTHLTTSADVPFLDCAYKLQEYAGLPKRKRSTGKATWPGRKQVFRQFTESGYVKADLVTMDGEDHPGRPLLIPVMRGGQLLFEPEPLSIIRRRAAESLASMPEALQSLVRDSDEPLFRPIISGSLQKLARMADEAHADKSGTPEF